MVNSQNGYPVLDSGDTHKWVIPNAERHFVLAPHAPGFVLAWWASWYDDNIARLDVGQWDEWGWAVRPVRGSSSISNHASGTAIDLNATRHPLGSNPRETLTDRQIVDIRLKLRDLNAGIRWGGDYSNRKDPMHYEIDKGRDAIETLANRLRRTERGEQIRKLNN